MSIDNKVREWKEAGLLDEVTGQRLIDYEYEKLAVRETYNHKPPILILVGSILLALSIFSFVAANWQLIPDSIKISGFLILMVSMYVIAEKFQRQLLRYVTLFRVFGIIFFIAAMAVIFSTYNFSSQLSLLYWLIFAVSVLHRLVYQHTVFTLVAALTALLAHITSYQNIGLLLMTFGFCVTWAWFHYADSTLDRIFSWLNFYALLLMLGQYFDYEGRFWPLWSLVVLHGLLIIYRKQAAWQQLYVVMSAILSIGYLINATEGWWSERQPSVVEATLVSIVLVSVYLLHRRQDLMWVSLLAVIPFSLFEDSGILLAVLLEVIAFTYLFKQDRSQKPIALAFIYFLIIQMTIYFIYVWDKLDISLFFLLGALIVFTLSSALWWRNRTRGDA